MGSGQSQVGRVKVGDMLAGGSNPVEFGGGTAYHNKDWGVAAGGTSRGRVYGLERNVYEAPVLP